MTITFSCPYCGNLCAFPQKHAGRRARCTKCQQRFIIPAENNQKAQKIKTEVIEEGPFSGFYKNLFTFRPKGLLNTTNLTGVIFITMLVCLKFYLRHKNYIFSIYARAVGRHVTLPLPFGLVTTAIVYACLFWYYMQIIYSTAFGTDEMPDVFMGSGFQFIATVLSSFYSFLVALTVTELPFLVIIAILKKAGFHLPWLFYALGAIGLFMFPIALLTIAVGKDLLMLLQPSCLLRPVTKAARPYLLVASLVMPIVILHYITFGFGVFPDQSLMQLILKFAACIAVAFISILPARAIGLFYRHYGCYMAW